MLIGVSSMWCYVLLSAFLESQVVENSFLTIVVLDVEDSGTPSHDQCEWNITGRTDTIFAVVQWKEISNVTQNIHRRKLVFNQSNSVMLLTPRLCENPFLLDTILPSTAGLTCIAPNGAITPTNVPCENPPKRRRRAVKSDPYIYYCVYRYDPYKKAKVVVSIIRQLKWKNVIILYNNESELSCKTVTEKMYDNVVFTMYNIDKLYNQTADLFSVFHVIYQNTEYDDRNVLVICSQTCINYILNEANDFDKKNNGATAMKDFSKWLIVDFKNKTQLFSGCEFGIDNIAVVNFPFTDVQTSLLKVSLAQSFDATVNIVIDDYIEPLDEDELDRFVQEELQRDLNNLTACWKAEIYTLLWKPECRRLLSPVGHVDYLKEDVKLFPDVIIFPNTKFGFNKRVFKTTTNEWKPFTRRLPKINGTVHFEGYSFDILDVLAASLNFSYVLTEPEDGDWGVIDDNGRWTGVVGQLARREVDLFAGPLTMSSAREDVIDFTFPYFHLYTSVIFRRPDPNKTKWRKLIDPFKWEVHVCIFGSFFGIILFLYLIERLNPYYITKLDERPTLQGLALYLFGALLTQGGSSMPSSVSGRSLLAAWWIFCIITVATYSGNLIAYLTVSKDKLPFETLAELGQQPNFKWGTLGGSIWVSLIKDSNLSDYKRLWAGLEKFNKTDPDVFSLSQDVHRLKVETEDYGFIADKTTAEAWIFNDCDLTDLKERFFPMNYAFGLQNNSPYLPRFSDELMKLVESGLAETLKRTWFATRNVCLESVAVAKQIQLIDLQSAFYVIGIGIFVALVNILIERCFERNERGIVFKYQLMCRLFKKRRSETS